MKYGQQLEHESVPEWSLYNLDYNSLKHEIKVHTTRDQATAIAIPGHQDATLKKFEDNLYGELCRQHDRVDLFITSKADEISRRLGEHLSFVVGIRVHTPRILHFADGGFLPAEEHLASQIQRWVTKYSDANDSTISLKRQRRFAKYERELLRCGEEIHGLSRFANAQVVAFRKILKKYKKWTGSVTLSARFNENILSDPKSFTKRTFEHLQSRHDEILTTLLAVTPHFSEPSSPESHGHAAPEPASPKQSRPRHVDFEPLPAAKIDSPVKYWNEYDDGSEAGGPEDEYAIYINPEEDTGFPGFAYVNALLSLPYEKAKQWFKSRQPSHETRPLLTSELSSQGSLGYASTAVNTDSEEEGYASSDGYPQLGYATHYALPSISEQKIQRYREKALMWGTLGCFVASFALLGIASMLILTGKRKLRVEVDAGVTIGVMVSLFCAGSGLGMTLYRRDPLSIPYKLMVSSAFVASCILNGMLLVLVMGNAS